MLIAPSVCMVLLERTRHGTGPCPEEFTIQPSGNAGKCLCPPLPTPLLWFHAGEAVPGWPCWNCSFPGGGGEGARDHLEAQVGWLLDKSSAFSICLLRIRLPNPHTLSLVGSARLYFVLYNLGQAIGHIKNKTSSSQIKPRSFLLCYMIAFTLLIVLYGGKKVIPKSVRRIHNSIMTT